MIIQQTFVENASLSYNRIMKQTQQQPEEKKINQSKSRALSKKIVAFFFVLALLLFAIAYLVYRFR